MYFWNNEKLKQALPNAKFYNFDKEFTAAGICVSSTTFYDDSIALIRSDATQKGIPDILIKDILPKVKAFITANAEPLKEYGLPIVEVENVKKTLFFLARWKRAQFKGVVIDITGSAGKSTVTQMCYDTLKDYGASANLSRANTNFGISWSMTHYDQDARFWINETSLGGGITLNSLLTMPNIAVITNIAPVHLKPNQEFKNVAIEKAKIFDYIKPNGIAILYKEMEFFDYVLEKAKEKASRIITFGRGEDSDIKILPGEENYISVFGQKYLYNNVPTPEHILLDSAIVAGIFYVAGLKIEDAFEKLNNFDALEGRGQQITCNIKINKKITLIDESFNANPISMKFTLQGFRKLYGDKKNKLLILGDMAEGGTETIKQHLKLMEYIEEINPTRVMLCGNEMKNLYDIMQGKYHCKHFNNADKLIEELPDWIFDDDYILVKGSHSTELSKVVEWVKSKI